MVRAGRAAEPIAIDRALTHPSNSAPPARGRAHGSSWFALALVVVLALVSSACDVVGTGPGTTPQPALGVVGASGNYYPAEVSAGVQVVTIAASWASAEPTQGTFSTHYAAQLNAKIDAARAAGLDVILDPGMQYTPAWVFNNIQGGTRFVDQFGDVFTGPPASGNNVANAVTNLAVRSALNKYLTWLGTQIPRGELWAVRQGGGPLGELRYPTGTYNGHTGAYWAYDASTQATSPVPGWKPGTGTTAQAQAFLDAYNTALDNFGKWLNGTFHNDFATRELVMLPGWGQRPGVEARVVASLLTLDDEEFNQGLDWTTLLAELSDKTHAIAYTTYLDAPSTRDTTELEDPADFLAGLVSTDHLAGLGGENTGTPTVSAMNLILTRAKNLHLAVVAWMSEHGLETATGSEPTMATLQQQAASVLG